MTHNYKPEVESKETKNDIYMNLDSLLDTRLSLLFDFDKKLFNDLLKDGDIKYYLNRITDSFGYIDNDLFKELYKKRDSKTIREPIPTHIPQLIKSYIAESLVEHPKKRVKLFLNVYPYVLSDNDKIKIRNGIRAIFNGYLDVEIMDVPENLISVKFVYENIGLMIMYNGLEWAEYQIATGHLVSLRLPDVMMIAPKLYTTKIYKNDSVDKSFTDLEKILHAFIKVTFINVKFFSIKINDNRNNTTSR